MSKVKITKNDRVDFNIPKDFNMKFIEHEMKFNIYKVRYSYKTNRGNNSENYKYLIAPYDEEAKLKTIEFLNKFNKEKPYRTISNVKILDVELIGTVTK